MVSRTSAPSSRGARLLLEGLAPRLDGALVRETIEAPQDTELQLRAQRQRVADLEQALEGLGNDDPDVPHLLALAGDLVSKGVWIIGGDGWACLLYTSDAADE